mmetsp:Transcript_18980/g.40883  ORF Transcript_18980/g.40883 Transcript_18980/m.40883 type:complete len:266 (+) Transcript_18980:729-1526(+)
MQLPRRQHHSLAVLQFWPGSGPRPRPPRPQHQQCSPRSCLRTAPRTAPPRRLHGTCTQRRCSKASAQRSLPSMSWASPTSVQPAPPSWCWSPAAPGMETPPTTRPRPGSRSRRSTQKGCSRACASRRLGWATPTTRASCTCRAPSRAGLRSWALSRFTALLRRMRWRVLRRWWTPGRRGCGSRSRRWWQRQHLQHHLQLLIPLLRPLLWSLHQLRHQQRQHPLLLKRPARVPVRCLVPLPRQQQLLLLLPRRHLLLLWPLAALLS